MATLRYIPAIGTEFPDFDKLKKIYKRFLDYFEIVEKDKGSVRYRIVKEPCEELIKAIEEYNDDEVARNAKKDMFVRNTAKKVIKKMSNDDKEFIIAHPDSVDHHLGLGMYIRNRYIHGKDLDIPLLMADWLSS